MTYKGYGVSRPVHPIPEKSPEEEDDNRRVEILIVENWLLLFTKYTIYNS